MPMFIPNPKSASRSIENITKSGINIDKIVRSKIRCDIKSILKEKDRIIQLPKVNRKTRLPLKETSLSSPSSNITFKSDLLDSKISFHKPAKKIDIPRNTYQRCLDRIKKENFEKEPLGDSLTSLQWLTGINVDDILDGKPIRSFSSSHSPLSLSKDNDGKRTVRKDDQYHSDGTVDYKQNHVIKPPYSYAALIVMAMKSKASGQMTLSEIYKWISDNFVFYRNAEQTWQNSIRHNLSLNKCFMKIPRKKGDPGKGGYWTIVPEFANKLLENSIRKRRSSMYNFDTQDMAKRKRLELLETQLLTKINSEENRDCIEEEKLLTKTLLHQLPLPTRHHHNPAGISITRERCAMDHSYGKDPVVNYNISDEESIRAIATHLKETTSNVDICTDDQTGISSDNTICSTLSNAIRTDCIWSSDQSHNLSERISQVAAELLDAQNVDSSEDAFLKTLSNSLNNNTRLEPSFFQLGSPLSCEDDGFSDDIDDIDDLHTDYSDEDVKHLTVRGKSVTLFNPMPAHFFSSDFMVKEEPLSPDSIDLNK